jgi:Ca2+-binding RTX toxin-like protein
VALTEAEKAMTATRNDNGRRRAVALVGGLALMVGGVVLTAPTAAAAGVLTLIGNNSDNVITVGRDAAGRILVTGAPVTGTPTVANTDLIQVFGLGGNDTLALSETGGALPRASVFGGGGADTLIGGSGADMLFGQAGNDVLAGKLGSDVLFGGDDADTLTGGDADDQLFGELGDDRMVWNNGDDTDLNEGGEGDDRVQVIGHAGSEVFTVRSVGLRVRLDRVGASPFSVDIGTSERLSVVTGAGQDSVDASGLASSSM